MGQIGTSGTSVHRALVPCVLSYTNLLLWHKNSTVNGQSISVTLPNTISPGGYLVHHEIIAFHVAVTLGGAEFFLSCTQILIGGSQTGTPDQTVSFLGTYCTMTMIWASMTRMCMTPPLHTLSPVCPCPTSLQALGIRAQAQLQGKHRRPRVTLELVQQVSQCQTCPRQKDL